MSEDMGYVWRLPGCGCVVAAQVDRPEYVREVAQFKRDRSKTGFVLDHLSVEEIRALPWGWPCKHMVAAEEAAKAPQEKALFTTGHRVSGGPPRFCCCGLGGAER